MEADYGNHQLNITDADSSSGDTFFWTFFIVESASNDFRLDFRSLVK